MISPKRGAWAGGADTADTDEVAQETLGSFVPKDQSKLPGAHAVLSGVRAAARVYYCGAGATVACNVLVKDLNPNPAKQNARQIEVIGNGLAMGGGALCCSHHRGLSPHCCGSPSGAAGRTARAASQQAGWARGGRGLTPELPVLAS